MSSTTIKTRTFLNFLKIGDVVRIEEDGEVIDEFEIRSIYDCGFYPRCDRSSKCKGFKINRGYRAFGGRCSYRNRSYYKITKESIIINKITEIE